MAKKKKAMKKKMSRDASLHERTVQGVATGETARQATRAARTQEKGKAGTSRPTSILPLPMVWQGVQEACAEQEKKYDIGDPISERIEYVSAEEIILHNNRNWRKRRGSTV